METDKATAEIPSTHDGVVRKLHFNIDDVCLVGHALVDIEVDDAAQVMGTHPNQKIYDAPHGDHQAHTFQPQKQVDKAATASPGKSKALATPAVRHLAKKHHLDLTQVPASGKDGRVTKEDVLNFISGGAQTVVEHGLEQPKPTPGL